MLKNLCLAAMLCLVAIQAPAVTRAHEVANDPAHNLGEAVLAVMREELAAEARPEPAPASRRRLRAQHDGPHPELEGKPGAPSAPTGASPAAAGPALTTTGGGNPAAQTTTATATPSAASTTSTSTSTSTSISTNAQSANQNAASTTTRPTTAPAAPGAAGNVVPQNAGMFGGLNGILGGLNPLTAVGTLAHSAHEAILGHTNTIKSPFMQQQEAAKAGGAPPAPGAAGH